MRVLGIITARGGSKGIPRKNLAPVCGKPLIEYTIKSAQSARKLTETIVSTDDQEIAEVCMGLGVEAPFLRPEELARDTTPTLPVLQHAITTLSERGRNFDAVCLLQPTSPQRSRDLIDRCIEQFETAGTDSLITVSKIPHAYNPMWVYWMDSAGHLALATGGVEPIKRRQDLPLGYVRDGRIYLTRVHTLMNDNSLFGSSVHGVELPCGINIDTDTDLEAFRKAMLDQGSSFHAV